MIFKAKTITIKSENELKLSFESSNKEDLFSHGNMNHLFETQKRLLLTNLDLSMRDTVLDLACGYGQQLINLSKNIRHGIGIDWSEKMIVDANKSKMNKQISNIDFYHIPIDSIHCLKKEFSKAYMVGAFEHLLDHFKSCEVVYNILQNNGCFMIMTQNKTALWHQLAKISQFGLKHHSTDRFFNCQELQSLFEKIGFKNIKLGYWNFVPEGDIIFPFNKLFSVLQCIFGKVFPSLFKGGIYIVGTK